jgi:hypothetical protein
MCRRAVLDVLAKIKVPGFQRIKLLTKLTTVAKVNAVCSHTSVETKKYV